MENLRFKGTVSVVFDPAKVEARLRLSRAGETIYDEDALVKLLNEAGVTTMDVDAVADLVTAFQKSRNSEEEVVAVRGVPAVPGTAEVWDWLPQPDPSDELKAVAPQVVHDAGPPEVFRVRTEKTGDAVKEIRERVLVDPNALSTVWVASGTKLATVLPPKPGQPGKNVLGQPIAAPLSRAGAVFAGRGLRRRGPEITADVSGFLRRGRDWADIVPFQKERWEVTYSDDRSNAYLSFEPSGGALAGSAVLERLTKDGFSPLPDSGMVQTLLDEAFRKGTAFQKVSLASTRDGSFIIRFSDDRSAVYLDLRKPLGGGSGIPLSDLPAGLRVEGLKTMPPEADKAVQKFLSSPDSELLGIVLAKGTPAVPGQNQELEFTIDFFPEADLKSLRESLTLPGEPVPDQETLKPELITKAAPVRAGQEFARLETPRGGKGRDGVDVMGKPIPAPAGGLPPLLLLSNVKHEGQGLLAAIDGLLEVGEVNGATAMRVRPHSDAAVIVSRSTDNFEATLTLHQGRGTGKRLERAQLDAALATAQVRFGLDEKALAAAWAEAQAGKPVESILIARGTPPANDVARRLTFHQKPRTDAEGRQRVLVRAGEEVASYLTPAEGEIDGRDVLGNLIPSPDAEVRSLVVSPDLSVSRDDAGRLTLTALKSGEVLFDGDSVSIVTQIAVASVGGKAGNVKFPGEVFVAGAVETGAYIMAGNLKVKGRVGGSLLSSDRNIQVASGIHGEGKAVLRAKNHVSVGFVERALIMAVGDVHVGKTALGCTFRVNGKIIQKTSEGGVQGGSVKVRLGLDVMNLGSPSGAPTTVSFGQDYLVEDQILAEVKETDKLREAIVRLDLYMRGLTAPVNKEKLSSARQQKVLMMKMLDKRNLKLINLRDKFDLHVPSEILIHETLFPGVSIESHGRVYETSTKKTALKIVFSEQTGRIEEFPLD